MATCTARLHVPGWAIVVGRVLHRLGARRLAQALVVRSIRLETSR